MIVLAIDPGADSGWALSEPPLSGAIDHRDAAMVEWWGDRPDRGMATAWVRDLDRPERLKRTLGAYLDWLGSLIRQLQPELLIVEQQLVFRGRSGTHCKEFRGVTLAVAGRADIACLECAPVHWRPYLFGRPYNPATDHQLAAECMLAWWAAKKQAAWPPGLPD